MDKREIRQKFSANGEDGLLVGRLLDKIEQADRGYTVYTRFLDPHERLLARRIAEYLHVRHCFYGGYEGAERAQMAVLAEYEDEQTAVFPISLICIEASRFARALTHRDYLGALMGLQVTRESIGDILVEEGRAQIFVCETVCGFIVENLIKVGSETVSVRVADPEAFHLPERELISQMVWVPSMRLDCLIAEGFRLSRGKAAELIAAGNVYVQFEECCKPAAEVHEGDILSLRGFGRAKVAEIGGTGRKGKTAVLIQREK